MKKEKEKDEYPQYRPFPLYVVFICGVLLLIMGIYQIITNEAVTGIAKFRGITKMYITGTSTLIIGLLGCATALYFLNKNKKRR